VRLPVFGERGPGGPRVPRCRVLWHGGIRSNPPVLTQRRPPLITDKQQRVRHLSPNCQGSKGRKHGQTEGCARGSIERFAAQTSANGTCGQTPDRQAPVE